MKKLYLLCILAILSINIFAQAPESFRYQAVLRDGSGVVRADQSAGIDIDILQGSSSGTVVYSESHSASTNAFGLVSLDVGKGSTSDDFISIDWSNGPYFIRISVDGNVMGTSQLLSVPYAKYADRAGNGWALKENDTLYYDKGNVGVGTDRPDAMLTVEGNGETYETKIRDNYAFLGLDGLGGNPGIHFLSNDQWKTTLFYSVSSDIFRLRQSGSGLGLVLNGSNYVGINTTNPQSELHVDGAVRIDQTASTPEPNTIYGNSMPLAYASINGTGALKSSYGIASINRTATGAYTITLSNAWSGHPAVMVTCFNYGANDEIATYSASTNDNVVNVNISDGAGNAMNSDFSLVVFGASQ